MLVVPALVAALVLLTEQRLPATIYSHQKSGGDTKFMGLKRLCVTKLRPPTPIIKGLEHSRTIFP